MAGAKGRSGGRRAAGAGRKPGATTQIKMPKSKGINEASTSGRWPPDANATKLVTVFFANASSCCRGGCRKYVCTALDPGVPNLVALALLGLSGKPAVLRPALPAALCVGQLELPL